jgi:hypothetical protein
MTGAEADPSERAEVLLLRAEELLQSGGPESRDEAALALEGARDAAQAEGVDQALRDRIDQHLAEARRGDNRREPGPG